MTITLDDELVERAALRDVVKAWEVLTMGYYSPREIEEWLKRDMQPVINNARRILALSPSKNASSAESSAVAEQAGNDDA
jgi:ribose 1,5-bisphosphokinase PhnN